MLAKLISKWTKRIPHTGLGFIKIDLGAKVEVGSKIFSPSIGLLAEIETEIKGIVIITTEIINPTIEMDPETIIDMTTEEITTSPMIATDKKIEIDKIIEGMTTDKDIETGVKVGIDQEIVVMTVLEVETEIETETDGCNLDPELCQMTEEDQGLDLTQE